MSPDRDPDVLEDEGFIPIAGSPGPKEERAFSRFPEDRTVDAAGHRAYGDEDMSQVYITEDHTRVHIDGTPAGESVGARAARASRVARARAREAREAGDEGIRETALDMRKGMLTTDQARAIGKKVKKWMEFVVKTEDYSNENLHRLGRELFDWMHETTGKREFPRHEQWDHLLWSQAKTFPKEVRNKIMGMSGKGWQKRMLAAAATSKIKKANDELAAFNRDQPFVYDPRRRFQSPTDAREHKRQEQWEQEIAGTRHAAQSPGPLATIPESSGPRPDPRAW